MLDQGIREMEQLVASYEADGLSFLTINRNGCCPTCITQAISTIRLSMVSSPRRSLFVVDARAGRGLSIFEDTPA